MAATAQRGKCDGLHCLLVQVRRQQGQAISGRTQAPLLWSGPGSKKLGIKRKWVHEIYPRGCTHKQILSVLILNAAFGHLKCQNLSYVIIYLLIISNANL